MSRKIVGVTVGTTMNPKTIAERLGDLSGSIYTASKSVQITEEGIDTYTNGATLTVPAGTYIVTASAVFQTGPGSGSRNNQVRILSGSTVISRERIFTAAINYGELRTTAIYTAKESVTFLVQKSSSITEKSSGNTSITALRLFQSGTPSGGGEHTHPSDDIEDLDELLAELNQMFAKKEDIPSIPDKVSAFENDVGYLKEHQSLEGYAKKDELPTVPTKVSAFENDKGYLTEHQSLEEYAKKAEIPSIPDKVSAFENDKGYLTMETDPTVPDWAKTEKKPVYTASEVGADEQGAAANLVSAHNTSTDVHSDIRLLIKNLTDRLDAVANSDDKELDQLSEIVAYIKSNKSLIDGITTSKVSVADIINNLTTNVVDKPLSAAQGVVLKALIDAITVPTKVSQLENDEGYLKQHQDLSAYAKKTDIPSVPSSLPANGGNADTVDGKHIVVSSSAPTNNDTSIITFVI